MEDSQELRQEARDLLSKAQATTDEAIRRLLHERALRLAQKAGMLEQAALMIGIERQGSRISSKGARQAAPRGTRMRLV